VVVQAPSRWPSAAIWWETPFRQIKLVAAFVRMALELPKALVTGERRRPSEVDAPGVLEVNVIRAQRLAFAATGLAWAALACGAAPGQTEASGTWHHFGDAAPAAAPNGSGGSGAWRHFSDSGTAPKPASPEATHPPRTVSVSNLEIEMLELVNRARLDPANAAETGGHALPLKWNASLAAVAREHSRDMLMRGYFGHNDPDGKSPGMRVKAAGIEWQAVGENIAAFDSVEGAEKAFMNEPRFARNHRGNILSPKYTEIGIGIVQSRSGRYYITQEFVEAPTDLRAAFPQ